MIKTTYNWVYRLRLYILQGPSFPIISWENLLCYWVYRLRLFILQGPSFPIISWENLLIRSLDDYIVHQIWVH